MATQVNKKYILVSEKYPYSDKGFRADIVVSVDGEERRVSIEGSVPLEVIRNAFIEATGGNIRFEDSQRYYAPAWVKMKFNDVACRGEGKTIGAAIIAAINSTIPNGKPLSPVERGWIYDKFGIDPND